MKKMTSFTFSFLIFLSSISITSTAQRKKTTILKYDALDGPGNVLLADGTELSGEIVFNDTDGIVRLYKNGESRSFTSKNVQKFEFYVKEIGRYRVFYALEFDDPPSGIKEPLFFEILKELKDFIVLMKIERMRATTRNALGQEIDPWLTDRSYIIHGTSYVHLKQTRIIYFMDSNSKFEPYVKIDNNERWNKYIDSSVFKNYTGYHYPALVEYAKNNKLSFKRKDDIIVILDEYERLITH
jgi:hypothetical protein